MIEKTMMNDLERKVEELKCLEETLADQIKEQSTIERDLEETTRTIIHLKHQIADLQQEIASSKTNC